MLEADVLLDDPSLLDTAGVEFLNRLEPYGAGNPRPTLVMTGVQVASRALVGSGRHLKLKLIKNGVTLDGIFFSAGDELPPAGSRIDVAFCPQINEYRGVRSVQLHLIDLRPGAARGGGDEAYDRFRRGEELTAAEARALLPTREEFVVLWRYLKQQAVQGEVPAQTARQLARDSARAFGAQEDPVRTLVCLDVLRERGLISLRAEEDRLCVTLLPVREKVDLDASQPLSRLRRMAQAEENASS